MSVLSPPEPGRDELELLIREARARQRRRWLGALAAVAVSAGCTIAAYSIAGGGNTNASRPDRATPGANTTRGCGIRVVGPRVFGPVGGAVYREPIPGHYTHPNRIGSQVRCSRSTIWVVFFNGVAMSQEGYFGVRSGNGGRTWRAVFTERFFGMKAPHQLDAYLGPWTVTRRGAFFTGLCPACGDPQPTISLSVTRDGGHTFRRYNVPALRGYEPTRIRVSGNAVTIGCRRLVRKVNSPPFEIYGHRTVTIHTA